MSAKPQANHTTAFSSARSFPLLLEYETVTRDQDWVPRTLNDAKGFQVVAFPVQLESLCVIRATMRIVHQGSEDLPTISEWDSDFDQTCFSLSLSLPLSVGLGRSAETWSIGQVKMGNLSKIVCVPLNCSINFDCVRVQTQKTLSYLTPSRGMQERTVDRGSAQKLSWHDFGPSSSCVSGEYLF